jgi:hypothetical protein
VIGWFFFYAYHKGGDFMWQPFNNNPVGRAVGDCAVRAVSAALDIPWESAYALMATNGFSMGDMPSSNSVWGAVLRQHGFSRQNIADTCPDCYTFADFSRDNPVGVFVLGTGTHVATVKNGVILDAWDSSNEIPQFVWYKP